MPPVPLPPTLPPLVLLPGTLCDERVFAPLLRLLRARFAPASLEAEVVMTPHCRTLRAAAEQVLAAAPPRFALLGFSLGGMVALEAALLAPERVLGLALLNVNAAPAPAEVHEARREAVRQAQAVGHDRFVCDELWAKYVGPAALPDAGLQQAIATMARALGHEAFDAQTEAALARRDYRPLLATITAPTTVLAGEHDALCPAGAQRSMAEALPDARFTLFPGAGHFALLEQEDATAASVAAWFHTIAGSADEPPLQETA